MKNLDHPLFIKNSSGFATYSMIIVAPLLLVLCFFMAWMIWFLIHQQKLENLCHYRALKAQEYLVNNNNQVISLNPIATGLITKKRLLTIAMLSPIPAVATAARISYNIVKWNQKVLSGTQKSLIISANSFSRMESFLLRKDFYRLVRSMENFWNQSKTYAQIDIYWKTSQIRQKFKAIAPPYKRLNNHKKRQQIFIRWKISTQALFPQWLRKILPIQNLWIGQCSSEPYKRRNQWIPSITKDKALLKL